MHISLDSVLGRQRRLNQVGETISSIAAPAAAYSLRSLTGGDPKVVRVRRSSNEGEEDFTASGVSSGALLDFVNEDISVYTQPSDLTISANSSPSGTFFLLPSYTTPNTIGHTFQISFELKRNSGGSGSTGGVSVRNGSTWNYTTITKSSNLDAKPSRFEINTSSEDYQTYNFTATTNAGSNTGFLRFKTFDSDDSYTVRNFTVAITGSNGFVDTWYDQSGNGNDAVQPTDVKQPTIVSAGSLLDDGILFDANINLPLSGTGLDIFKNVAHGNIFSVLKPLVTTTGNTRFFEASISAGARFLFGDAQSGSTNASFRVGGRASDTDNFSDLEVTDGTTHGNQVSLLTAFIDYGNSDASLFLNGSGVVTGNLANMTDGNTTNSSATATAIGSTNDTLTSNFNAKEIIIYNTDQSSNRTALETNIKSYYGIS